jgi:exodeoxyribonuclease V alpha subunit
LSNSNKENEVVFKGTIIRNTYNSEDYKVYAIDVNRDKYPKIKFTKYGNAIISGEIHDLGIGQEYEIKAIEQHTKYGISYKVLNITREKPQSYSDMYIFLQEILTLQQAETLYNVYPSIVQKVINNDLNDIDLNKLKGIKEFTFNSIKNKIVENFCLAELVAEFQGLISLSMLKKLYEKYTSVLMIKKKLKAEPYKCLCGLSRIGFTTADSILLELERISNEKIKQGIEPPIKFEYDLKTSENRCLACMMYLLEQNENDGHTKMSITELRNQIMKMCPACSHHFVSCIKFKDIYYDKEQMVVALQYTYEKEKYIAENIISGLSVNNIWNFDYSEYNTVNGCILSEEQTKILDLVCKNNICILNGSAGVGKSFSTQAIINMLKDNNKSFMLCSPTGRAAKVLADYTKEHASTIHRGLGYMPPDEWGYNKERKMNYDILIIDEFSMVDIFLFSHVIDAIDFNKTKLLMVGDNAQLPSVACGNILHDFMQSNIIPTVTLNKVFRYGEGGLMKVATDVRCCKKYLPDTHDKVTCFGSNKDYVFIDTTTESIVKSAVALYEKLLKNGYKPEDMQMLTAYKKGECGSIAINNHLQKIANPNFGSNEYMKIGDTIYFKSDMVIQNINNYHAKLFIDNEWCEETETFIANGEIGVIVDVFNNYVVIDFDGVHVKYYRDDMQMCGLGYGISIHKSQGGSAKVIILLTPKSHTFMLNSNLIYVGLTRMKEKCYHLGDIGTVNSAIKKKENLSRNTFLLKLLQTN